MVKTAPARRTPHAALSAHHLVVRFGRRTVLRGCTLEVEAGAMVALLGRNGAGKSTLLRCLSGVLAPQEGEVLLGGRSLREVGRREIARALAVVPQEVTVPFSFNVREMVALGRTPYVRPLVGATGEDRTVVEETLARLDLRELAGQRFESLSAGERQRVAIGMALAQQPRLLLLDEPTAHLDVAHQLEILGLLRELHQGVHHGLRDGFDGQRLTILATMHDLNLAALAFDHLLLLHDGRIVAAGPPAEVLTEEMIHQVYGAHVSISRHPTRGVPQVTLLP